MAATIEQASVELTSPTTTTTSAGQRADERFERHHHARGLLGVRARTDAEVFVGRADVELVEEDLAHRLVVVLAGVHQHRLGPGVVERDRAPGAIFMKFGRAPR